MAGVQLRAWRDWGGLVSTLPAPARGDLSAPKPQHRHGNAQVTLIDLLDRLLQGGIAIHGDIVLSAANIDLVEVDLRVLIAAVDKAAGR